ncbi:peroxisomal membrane protein PEX16-like [Galendromus occidentalis]|uniref:Peroxisomal membrane protein PEX16 n=1 Tax=Galendromus occidentalis TaxID=34638 RepID=A0AAJ6QXB1_9ACAR|nr:peroxisomal membrane protein PEX16-like [Galendromus occidentalis]
MSVLSRYREFVEKNPIAAKQVEAVIEIFTFWRVHGGWEIFNEGMRASAKLVQLAHDIILRRHHALPISAVQVVSTLKTILQALDYLQCFLEKITFFASGDAYRWSMIAFIQTAKTVIRAVLLFHFKQGMSMKTPVPPLERGQDLEYASKLRSLRHEKRAQATFTLKSGREVRTLAATPPLNKRRWCETKKVDPMEQMEEKFSFVPTELQGPQLIGEVMYLMTPMAHLFAMKLFGTKSWKPFLIALGMDALSIQQMQQGTKQLQKPEKIELSRRARGLAEYFLRAPLYETHVKSKLQSLKQGIFDMFPFITFLDQFVEYELNELETTYFRTWGSH